MTDKYVYLQINILLQSDDEFIFVRNTCAMMKKEEHRMEIFNVFKIRAF